MKQPYYPDLKDKVALVAGGAGAIGQAIAESLAANDAIVVSADLQAHSTTLSTQQTSTVALDVVNPRATRKAVDRIEAEVGPIDLLVNVAGILRTGSLLELSDDDWHDTFAVNTTGAFNVCRSVGTHMARRRRGSIVAVGSNAATIPRISMGSYSASKAALTQFMKCLGLELAPLNIRCNTVAPGSTETPMQHQLWVDNGAPAIIDGDLSSYRNGIPLRRMAQPKDIANVVMFLLSENARHITMETTTIDGGASLGC